MIEVGLFLPEPYCIGTEKYYLIDVWESDIDFITKHPSNLYLIVENENAAITCWVHESLFTLILIQFSPIDIYGTTAYVDYDYCISLLHMFNEGRVGEIPTFI